MDLAPQKTCKYRCAVAICTQKSAENGITFHRFPKDPARRKSWISKCRRQDKFNPVYARVCSRHFLPEHFIPDKVNAALGLPTRRCLSEDAIPTLYLSEKERNPKAKAARSERLARRATQKEFQEVKLNLASVIKETIINSNITYEIVDVSDMFIMEQANEEEQPMVDDLAQEMKKSEKLKMKYNILKQKLNQKTLKCNQLTMEKIVIQKLMKARASASSSRLAAAHILQKLVLSSSGVQEQALSMKKGWPSLDIMNTLALRTLSRKNYELIQNKTAPLPSLRWLSQWTKGFLCEPGIIKEAVLLLRAKTETIPVSETFKRLCVLSFDEMSTSEVIFYSKSEDRVYGSAKTVQVVVLRGLCSDYKQVIFYDFNYSMTPEKLAEIIIEVEKTDLNVVAVTPTMGKNHQLWNTLAVGTRRPYILHPLNEAKKIWIFYDVPLLLKLLHNHFIDDGITTSTGDVLNKETIATLLEHDIGQEVKFMNHMSVNDLTIGGSKRQQVFQATRLFSGQTANAFLYSTNNNAAFLFFKLVNEVLDVFNSRLVTCSTCPLRSAFQKNDLKQTNTLQKFEQECLQMRCGGRKVMLPFQMAFIISIRSLFGFSEDMSVLGVKHIFTAKLNHDCLENLFSRVKSLGGANPNAFEFKTRLQMLFLTKNIDCIPTNATPDNDTLLDYDGEDLASFVSNELLIDVIDATSLNFMNASDENEDFAIDLNCIASKDKFKQESDGLIYLAGYVAHRCREIDQTLGSPTEKIPLAFVNKWLSICSYGGLLMPSTEFLELFNQFEIFFTTFHASSNKSFLTQESGVQKRLIKMLSEQYPSIDERIICCYVNARTYFRINFYNLHIRSKSVNLLESRKRKNLSSIENL